MAQSLVTQHGGEPNPLDTRGLCLLSLCGDGVRGLSTLYILKSIMTQLNGRRQSAGLPSVKPCEIFDLIGGTSTGGLIAILLSRLEMDVDECITSYSELTQAVFEKKSSWLPVGLTGKVQPQFNSSKLKSAIENVITSKGASPTDAFNDGKDRGCRTFVCATAKETQGITRLRSYTLLDEGNIPATICQAALATFAATGFFNPISIGNQQFVDGALSANNPVDEVEGEAANIWSPGTGELKPLVKCFLSIGTEYPGKEALEDNMLGFLSESLVSIAMETEETEETERTIAYRADEQVKKTVALLEKVITMKQQVLKADHPDPLASQHALAITYRADGQAKEAVALLEQVVTIKQQVLKEDHPDRLASQHELAVAYRADGQAKKAVALLEQVVTVGQQVLKEDHPDRLASQHELAIAYRADGQTKKAVALLEQVVTIKQQVLKEDHPDRLASQHELAVTYQADGQVKKAVALLEQVVTVGQQVLKEDHPGQLASQHALAIAYRADGQMKQAVALLEQVVTVRQQVLKEDHPDRLASQHELAVAYQADGQGKKAVTLLEQVVTVKG